MVAIVKSQNSLFVWGAFGLHLRQLFFMPPMDEEDDEEDVPPIGQGKVGGQNFTIWANLRVFFGGADSIGRSVSGPKIRRVLPFHFHESVVDT